MASLLKKSLFAIAAGALLSGLLLQVPVSSAENLPTFKPIARGGLSKDSIYFVMTDRFANGNSKNDNGFEIGRAHV